MSSAVTKYGASFFLNLAFGQRVSSPPSYFLALLTQAPGEHTDGTLLSEPDPGAGYARMEVPNDQFTWSEADDGVIFLTSAVLFESATSDWPVVTHYALCDALVEGNVYLYGAFSVPRGITAGDQAEIPENLLSLSIGSLSSALVSTF